MTEIYIPFLPEFEEPMKYFQKWMTTRRKKYGRVWDTFTIFGEQFTIVAQFRCPLHQVAHDLYKAEGCESVEAFKEVWNRIHRIKGYEKQKLEWFWVHVFLSNYLLNEKKETK